MKNLLPVLAIVLLAGCSPSDSENKPKTAETKIASKSDSTSSTVSPSAPAADAATILARPQFQCYVTTTLKMENLQMIIQ
jgi:uncharacterized lipoprotein YajG